MEKTIILPEWRTIDSDQPSEPVSSYGTVTHHTDHRRVVFSGSTWPEGAVTNQVRQILSNKQHALQDLGGSMDDIIAMRLFVRNDVFSRDTQSEIHEVRAEFFEHPHYPASTMIGVEELLHPDALIEIEIEAEIPADGWEPSVVTGGG